MKDLIIKMRLYSLTQRIHPNFHAKGTTFSLKEIITLAYMIGEY